MFWGGERLHEELDRLITDFDPERIDYAAYRLRVGPEVYISPTGEPNDPRNKPKTLLAEGQGFTIPAGQFGFILTEERIQVPISAMALISIRAGYKFRGLVNVSGFHVDPNYDGRLIFSVFNAGPGPVHLSRGEPCFLIWFADLDKPRDVPKKKGFEGIPSDFTGPIANGLESFARLLSKINENDKALGDRVAAIESEQKIVRWATTLVLAALIGLGVRQCSLDRSTDATHAEATTKVKPAAAVPPATTPRP